MSNTTDTCGYANGDEQACQNPTTDDGNPDRCWIDAHNDSTAAPDPEEMDEVAADLALEAADTHEQRKAEQEDLLETIEEEEGAETVETSCNIIGDHVVDVTVTLDGELTDRIAAMEDRMERIDSGESHAYDISDVADAAAQMLADLTDDSTWDKATFYAAYQRTNIDALFAMLEPIFNSIEAERERREGAADGFRQKPEGT